MPVEDTDTDTDRTPDDATEQPRLTLWQMICSALAAGLGVQSSRNRQRDFAHGKASHFIAIGVIFTALFVIAMVLLVRFVLGFAGAGGG